MKRLLFLLTILSLGTPGLAWTQRSPQNPETCKTQAPYGIPQTSGVSLICREGYLVGYDAKAKIPKYVTYTLQPSKALGCIARSDAFVADQSVSGGPTPQDYVGTGYDKGHMVPDGDLSWNQQVEYESFLMTNMTPQAGSFNRGIWKLLETSVRGWTVQNNEDYTIYVGAIYNFSDKTIGVNVTVPHGLYKIVINNKTKEVAGWKFPHIAPYPNLGTDLTKFRSPIDLIQKESGVVFSLPTGAKELATGKEWPVNFGSLTNSKRQECKTK